MYDEVDNHIDIHDDTDDEQVSVSKDNYRFIDDSEQRNGNNVDFFRGFKNATRKLIEAMDDHGGWLDQRYLQTEIYFSQDKDKNEIEFDEFNNFETRNKKFRSKMTMCQKGSKYSFYNAVLYALVFKTSKKLWFCNQWKWNWKNNLR